jgi:selenide,water dikinase
MAVESMATLNLGASSIMKKHGCHGATDITGFGIKGHAENLVAVQEMAVDYNIHSLPILDGMDIINKEIFNFRLLDGYSAETSGGLLIMVPPEKVSLF